MKILKNISVAFSMYSRIPMPKFNWNSEDMKYHLIDSVDKKIGIFTDLHGGINKDSQYRLKETEKCVDWIISTFKKAKVDYIIFCGDLFDSRFSINVQTLNVIINCIQNLTYSFEKVFLIIR